MSDAYVFRLKDNNFNFLRLFAAIGVLMGHVASHMDIQFFSYQIDGSKPFFHLGVPFFFIMSGLLVYPSYVRMRERGETIQYYFWKRFIRLAPSVYFIMVVAIILFLAVGAITLDVFTEFTFWAWVASHITLMPVYHPDIFSHIGVGVVNGSLWTILTFMNFYLLVPVIYYIQKKLNFKRMILGMFLLSLIFYGMEWVLVVTENESIFAKLFIVSIFPNLFLFALGIFWSKYWESAPKNISLFVISLILLFIFKKDVLNIVDTIGVLNDLLWAYPLSYAVVWFGYEGFKFFRVFNKMEDLGMGIYIWHMLIVNLFLYLGLNEISWLNNWSMHILVIAITLILAYISRVLIEKPALKYQDTKFISKNKNVTTQCNVQEVGNK